MFSLYNLLMTEGRPHSSLAAMKRPKAVRIALAIAIISILLSEVCGEDEVQVNSINPTQGSVWGGMQLTIHGKGFAKNQFNYGDGSEHFGNFVLMVSATRSYECDIHKDGCTEKQIVCFTRAMEEDSYHVRVTVDGVKVDVDKHCPSNANNCKFTPTNSQTPDLSSVSPLTGPPGTLLTMKGKLMTSRLGSHESASTNGETKLMLRVFFGGQKCELYENFDDSIPFGIALDNDGAAKTGYMKCQMEGSYVSNVNGSFIVEEPYGRSYPKPSVLKVFADNSIAMFQTYARIDSVSPVSGSVHGGTKLTISGDNFDDTDKPLEVEVAGKPCDVIEHTKTTIVCSTPADPGVMSQYRGSRGVDHKHWDTGDIDLEDIDSLVNQSYDSTVLDTISFAYNSSATTMTSFMLTVPRSGEYRFQLTGMNCRSSLFFSENGRSENKTLVTEKSFSKSSTHLHSEIFDLEANASYYMEVLHTSKSNDDNSLSLGLRMYNTDKTASQTGAAVNERQRLTMKSKIVPETQTISFSGWPAARGSVNEKQFVDVVPASADGEPTYFRLGVDKAFSGLLSSESLDVSVAAALNGLYTISPDTVSVSRSNIAGGGYRYTVTFNSDRGSWPLIEYEAATPGAVTISVQRSTVGVASNTKAIIEMNDRPSKPVAIDANAITMKETIEGLFSVGCPSFLSSSSGSAFFEDFETLSVGYTSTHIGWVVVDRYPLCGRKSLKNPAYLVNMEKSATVSTHKYICFGYNGFIHSWMTFNFSYVEGGKQHAKRRGFRVEMDPYDGRWHHKCVDVNEILTNAYPEGKYFSVNQIQISRDGLRDTFFDNIYFGKNLISEPGVHDIRLMPPQGYLMNEVEVTSDAVGEYEIKLYPVNCSYPLSKFSVRNGVSDVTRVESASPPVSGTFDISYDNRSVKGVPADVSEEKLQSLLETLPGMGGMKISRTGLCHSYVWTADWLLVGGNRPPLVLDISNLQGIEAEIVSTTLSDGYVKFDPIIGDMAFQVRDVAPVTVNVNGIPSLCGGTCEYDWSSNDTPSVTSVTPQSGGGPNTLTITGTGFTSTAEVYVGKVKATNVNVVGDQLTCDIDLERRGVHKVMVYVTGKGKAGGDLTYEYITEVTSVSPSSGHKSGGYMVTLTGTGLVDDMTVTHDGGSCRVVSAAADSSQAVCQMLPTTMVGATDFLLEFDDGGNLTHSSAFTFNDAIDDSVVTSFSPASASVLGGTEVVITGTGFGSAAGSVDVGYGNQATVKSWTDTEIIVELPSLSIGDYPILVTTSTGYADLTTNSVADVAYQLMVTDIQPRILSKYGGTKHVISGIGFGTDKSVASIKMGPVECEIESITNSEIVCTAQALTETFHIDNSGTHSSFGKYYAWNPPLLEMQVGDRVEWQWSSPTGITDVVYTVQQTDDIDSKSPTPFGFQSPKAAAGHDSYSYEFTEDGVFNYWSGPVNPTGTLIMRGRIEVAAREPFSGDLNLMLGSHTAQVNVVARKRRDNRVKRSSCVPEELSCAAVSSELMSTCAEDNVKVTKISPNNGTSEETITITGTGFSTSDCNNLVMFGETPCTIMSSSAEEIQCKLSLQGNEEPGVTFPASVLVNNLGYALVSITGEWNKGYSLTPRVSGMSHHSGSLSGGQVLTISGDGFMDEGRTKVFVGYTECVIQSMTYTEIECLTGEAATWSGDIEVKVLSVDQVTLAAVCEGDCSYSYGTLHTPSLLTVTPDAISGDGDIVITGALFGSDSSAVDVYVGPNSCTVTAVSDDTIECSLTSLPAGTHIVSVVTAEYGTTAPSALTVTSEAIVTSIAPSVSSIHGGLVITISGSGFSGDTTVAIDGADCEGVVTTATSVVCKTPAHAEGDVQVVVTSAGGVQFPSINMEYSLSATPSVSNVSPSSGFTGETITITGIELSDVSSVSLGTAGCAVLTATDTEITCVLGEHAAGNTDLVVDINGKGLSDVTEFTFELSATSVTPNTGSFGGGQTVTVAGAGLDSSVTVTICGELCQNQQVTTSSVTCLTPAHDASGNADVTCDVIVTVSTESVTLSSKYTYDINLGGRVTGMSPTRGGTAGGTTLTLSGTSLNHAELAVSIDGVDCVIQTQTAAEVTCLTGAHAASGKFDVKVAFGEDGQAVFQDSAEFYYIDRWSSQFTWGGNPLPAEGEIVVVNQGQTLLLDMDTPILKVLLIQGGKLIFDEKDVELNAENILITQGGVLEVGTEDSPFQHKGIITLHGHLRSLEMPIYGAKTLGVRNGTLDLHGKPRKSWTVLENTAAAGSNQIVLRHPVDWEVGDHIAIASTGKRHSQSQNELREITAVSGDGKTITLNDTLDYEHLGVTVDVGGGHMLDMRAEVGLLTHNVVVRGSINRQWDDKIEACEAGFDTGQFATQTCFQGRFGEEMGSDEFGCAIMMHAPEPDKQWAVGRISHIEVTHAGQAFRLGRYPIHFHLNGHQNKSYVRGCSVHRTFNRAINIHNTHDVLIEHNVIYHVKGGAVFFEDSAETGNILQYNLAIFVIPSTSLLNDDITPAAFWLTHPSNYVRHNHAAGGTHFGFWYRMHTHPQGPSANPSLCPKGAPLLEFSNNTAHSLGWFGLWTFEDYYPMDGDGVCSQQTKNIPAVFETLTAWHCEKGAEWVNGGDLQFDGFFMANNEKAGIEGKINKKHTKYDYNGPLIRNSVIASQTGTGGCTARGIIFPFSDGFMVHDTEFVGFNQSGCAAFGVTTIDGKCSFGCGGYTYKFERITWTNTNRKSAYRWEHEAAYEDLDGSLTGFSKAKVVPTNPTLDPAVCSDASEWSEKLPASLCNTPHPFHRYSWNNPTPTSLLFKNALLSNEHGTSVVPWLRKRLTHPLGWMLMMMGHSQYELTYENGEHFTNTSSSGVYYMFNTTDYVIVGQQLYQKPDRFQVIGGSVSNGSESELSYENNVHGDWHLSDNLTFSYIVSGKTSMSKRSLGYGGDKAINFRVYTCYFDDCIPPPDPNQVPPPLQRPDDAIFWSHDTAWESAEEGMGGNNGDGTFSPPAENTDVKIHNDDWMVLDTQPATLNKLYIYGVLEFEPAMIGGAYMDFKLSATHILLFGGRLFVGWENNPMRGNVEIILRGDWSTEEQFMPFGGPTVGAKAIGVFGSLDIHGMQRDVYWTKLSQTAAVGSTDITVVDAVDWVVGDEIVIAASGKSAWENEVRKVTAVSGDKKTLTLNSSLEFKHTALDYTTGGYSYSLTAEVGLLTRNVKIIGHEHDELQEQSFGGRILVSDYFDGEQQWTGYARIENAEFYHMGQEGYIDYNDPRFSLAYLNTGPVSDLKPSYIRRNSFKDSFNTAIGVIDGEGILVEDNVIHGTVEAGIRIKSTDSTVNRNLVTFTQTRACYQERVEADNFFFHGSIEIMDATGVNMHNNSVAGSERTGYSVAGYPCADESTWSGNVAHGVMSGVVILPEYDAPSPCAKVSGFTVYHSHDYGVYAQTGSTTEFEDLILVENNLGLMPLVIGPGALSHITGDKYVQISNSLVVGSTPDRDCDLDYSSDPDECNRDATSQARSWSSPSGGSVGVSFGQFMSGSNNAPFKPWKGLMSYNTNGGLTRIKDVTFANFGVKCGSKRDYVMSTSPGNEDGQHPVEISSVTLVDVEEESKVFYHRPNVGKVNSADCVDMDCDAKKKCMVKDLDGTFLGAVGTVLPQSEYEWGGDPRRGLGDYRIPKTMLTDIDGNRLDVGTVAPNKGIIGNKDCTWMDSWTAYKCTNDVNYEMLLIESMDSDTETRRLSPVAVLGNKYIDLINGPQDHGWCSGYTCRKRVSTFMSLVATDEHYALYFTSTSPQHLRLTMLNAGPSEKITLEIYYTISNRIDVYVDGELIDPLNAEWVDGELEYKKPETYCQYCPQNQPSVSNGDNFQNRWEQLMYVTVTGEAAVDIKMSDMIMLTFDLVMTEDEFFGSDLSNNLAIFFGVPADKIRVVNVISEDTQLPSKRRRKRALQPGHITVEFEIGDSPTVGINDTITNGLTTQQLIDMRAELIDAAQTGDLAAQLGTPYSSLFVTVPLPDPSDPSWSTVAGSAEDYGEEIRIPSKIVMHEHPTSVIEGFTFTEASVQLVNSDNELVTQVGSLDWKVSVRLVSTVNPFATLNGKLEIDIEQGWANFTDLSIDVPGTDYQLEYYISSPNNVTYIQSVTVSVEIVKRAIDAVVTAPSTATANQSFTTSVALVEKGTNTPSLNWNGDRFRVHFSLNQLVDYNGGELIAANWTNFNPVDGTIDVVMTLTRENGYLVDIEIASFPDTSYGIMTMSEPIIVQPVGYVAPPAAETMEMMFEFDATLADIGASNEKYFEMSVFNHLMSTYTNVSVGLVDCDSDLKCKFEISGARDDVEATIEQLHTATKTPMAVSFNGNSYAAKEGLTVNGEVYTELQSTTTSPEEAKDDMLVVWIIVGVTVGVLLIIIVVTAICLYSKKSRPSKVSDTPRGMSPDFDEENMAYIGAPPISSKMPPMEPKRTELERVNERFKRLNVTSVPLPPITPKETAVKPEKETIDLPRWRY